MTIPRPAASESLNRSQLIEEHLEELRACSRCPKMIGPVVVHRPVLSKVLLIGQAPGSKEGEAGRPFAWTAGKTLFRWFESIGVSEEEFRSRAYMAAVCRCFPGKNTSGGDRVPSPSEIYNCSSWLEAEFEIVDPDLVIPIGRLAIEQLIDFSKLEDVIGKQHDIDLFGRVRSVIPLPHPSGASTWFKREPGKSLLLRGLELVESHPAWRSIRLEEDALPV